MALRPEHLPAVAKEFDRLLRERAITREQAEHFCDRTFTSLLEHRMRTKEGHPYLTPESNPEDTNGTTQNR